MMDAPNITLELYELDMISPSLQEAAQTLSKRELQERQVQAVMTEYRAEQQAMLDRTARLRALRVG